MKRMLVGHEQKIKGKREKSIFRNQVNRLRTESACLLMFKLSWIRSACLRWHDISFQDFRTSRQLQNVLLSDNILKVCTSRPSDNKFQTVYPEIIYYQTITKFLPFWQQNCLSTFEKLCACYVTRRFIKVTSNPFISPLRLTVYIQLIMAIDRIFISMITRARH